MSIKIRSYPELVSRIEEIVNSSENLHLTRLGTVNLLDTEYEMLVVHMGEDTHGKKHVCISAGIHGDEPAGPEAVLRFMEKHKDDRELLDKVFFTIFPCDNPSGYELGTRENAMAIDLNREFQKSDASPEIALLMKALSNCGFDFTYEMHEDIDSYGFYMYELARNRRDYVGHEIVKRIKEMGYPINTDEVIEGLGAEHGIISPHGRRLRRTKLPKAVYLYRVCCGHVITMEPPASKLELEDRVKIELAGLEVAIAKVQTSARGRRPVPTKVIRSQQ